MTQKYTGPLRFYHRAVAQSASENTPGFKTNYAAAFTKW